MDEETTGDDDEGSEVDVEGLDGASSPIIPEKVDIEPDEEEDDDDDVKKEKVETERRHGKRKISDCDSGCYEYSYQ